MSMMPDLSWLYPQEPDPVAEAQRLREQYRMAQELFPMPEQVQPQLGPEPGSTFGDQLALGIAQTPVPPMRGFLPNLIAGASRGYASARLAGMKSRAASNQQARADAAAANEANSRATLDLRKGWLNHVSDASKAYQAWKLEALKGAMKPTDEQRGVGAARAAKAENDERKRLGLPPRGRDRATKLPTPERETPRVPEDDRIDAAANAGLSFTQFARELAAVPNDSLRVAGLSRAVLLKKAGQRLKR